MSGMGIISIPKMKKKKFNTPVNHVFLIFIMLFILKP